MTIRACLFDAYGTLFDVHSAIGRYRSEIGATADALSALWRTKQLQYTWLRTLIGQYVDFWQVTEEALRYAFVAYGIEDPLLSEKLMQAYLRLDAYPDVMETLKTIKERGIGRYIVSNGSPRMLTAAVDHSGIGDWVDGVVSVDELRVYKPAPEVYQLGMDTAGIERAHEGLFVSANGWDAAGAGAFGFQVAWINRAGAPMEELPSKPTNVIGVVGEILGVLD